MRQEEASLEVASPHETPSLRRIVERDWVFFGFLGAAIIIGAGLRVYHLGTQSLWLDEAYSVDMAKQSFLSVITYLDPNNTNQLPLYNTLLHFWMNLGHDEFTLRLLSTIFAVGSIPVLYWLGCRLVSKRTGLIGAILLAVSPFDILWSQNARVYTIVVFFSLLSTAALVEALEGRRAWWLLYVPASVAAVYAHNFALFVLIAQALFVLIYALHYRQKLVWWAISLAAVVACCLPYAGAALTQVSTAAGIGWIKPPSPSTPFAVLITLTNWYSLRPRPLFVLLPIILLMVILAGSSLLLFARHRKAGVFLVLNVVVPFVLAYAVSIWRPIFLDRYLIVALPGLLLILAAGVDALMEGRFQIWKRRRTPIDAGIGAPLNLVGRYGGALLGLALVALNVVSVLAYYGGYHNESWREVANFVYDNSKSGDVILYGDEYGTEQPPFDYYYVDSLGGNLPRRALPADHSLDSSKLVPVPNEESKLWEVVGGYERVWLVSRYAAGTNQHSDELSAWLRTRFQLVKEVHWENSQAPLGVSLFEQSPSTAKSTT
jgi:mannosyltransferase